MKKVVNTIAIIVSGLSISLSAMATPPTERDIFARMEARMHDAKAHYAQSKQDRDIANKAAVEAKIYYKRAHSVRKIDDQSNAYSHDSFIQAELQNANADFLEAGASSKSATAGKYSAKAIHNELQAVHDAAKVAEMAPGVYKIAIHSNILVAEDAHNAAGNAHNLAIKAAKAGDSKRALFYAESTKKFADVVNNIAMAILNNPNATDANKNTIELYQEKTKQYAEAVTSAVQGNDKNTSQVASATQDDAPKVTLAMNSSQTQNHEAVSEGGQGTQAASKETTSYNNY